MSEKEKEGDGPAQPKRREHSLPVVAASPPAASPTPFSSPATSTTPAKSAGIPTSSSAAIARNKKSKYFFFIMLCSYKLYCIFTGLSKFVLFRLL